MAIETVSPEPDWPNIRKHLRATRPLWRLGGWGGAAVAALAALAIVSQTDGGSERLQMAIAHDSQPARTVAAADVTPRALEPDAETRALQAQVRILAADRDRLNARIASLEHSLDDMTGSINRQVAAAPAARSPAPEPSAPATIPQLAAAPPSVAIPVIAPLAMPASTDIPAPWPNAAPVLAGNATSEAVPLPPTRMAAAPAAEPPPKPELGVDLGGAPNLEVLGARWVAVKANFGPLLSGLHPLAVHNRRPGATDYRLLVGPLPNAAAAAQLCLRFAAARVTCRPAKFAGEQIAQR